MTDKPKVRITSPLASLNGLSHRRGQVVQLTDWPRPHGGEFEAVNDEARRALAFYAANRNRPGFPAKLLGDGGIVQLPSGLGYHARNLPPAEQHPEDHWPRYRLTHPVTLGGVKHEPGTEIAYLQWPTYAMQPANKAARAIAAYLAQHGESGALRFSPWCCFRNAPFLPDLERSSDPRPVVTPPELPSRRQRMHRARPRGLQPRVLAAV